MPCAPCGPVAPVAPVAPWGPRGPLPVSEPCATAYPSVFSSPVTTATIDVAALANICKISVSSMIHMG